MAKYIANFRAQSPKDSKFGRGVRFGASNDGAAAAIAAVLDGATAGQMTSLTKTIRENNLGAEHPEGTRISVSALTLSAGDHNARFNLRNAFSALTQQHIAALFQGEAYSAGGIAVGALSAPPKQPGSGQDIVTVNVTITDKS